MRALCWGLLIASFCLCPAAMAEDVKTEPGFTPLFNGKNLDGWKMLKGGASLDGKTEAAGGRFKVVEGVLVIDPSVKGDIRIETQKTYGKDAHIKFEFKPGERCNNDLFFRGMKFDIVPKALKNVKDGEWNTFEIIVKGDTAEFRANGKTEKTLKAKPGATTFGVRAEFGHFQLRNMQIKEGE